MAENTNIEDLRAPLLAALGAADLALATVNDLIGNLRERAEDTRTETHTIIVTVDNGIANGATVAHFSVAGKTGTAQIPSDDGRYADDAYISSFAGFAPANDPRFVAVIVIERPQTKLLGTITAMDTFHDLALDVLRSARVQPDRP